MERRFFSFSLLVTIVTVMTLLPWGVGVADLEDGLILHLDFEKEEPVDQSPNPADVSVWKGALKLVDGKVGQAGEFDGETYIQVADADKLDGMKALTIAVWINPDKVIDAAIASKRIANVNQDAYNLFMWTGNKLDGRINASGDFWSTTVMETGKWYHVAYVYDGDAQQQRIYINGVLDAEGAQTNQEVPQTTSSLWIGELDDARGFVYAGLMDEFGMWDRALDENEIILAMQGIQMPVEPQSKLAVTWSELKR